MRLYYDQVYKCTDVEEIAFVLSQKMHEFKIELDYKYKENSAEVIDTNFQTICLGSLSAVIFMRAGIRTVMPDDDYR